MKNLQSQTIHNLLTLIIYKGDDNTPIDEVGYDTEQQNQMIAKIEQDDTFISEFIRKSLEYLKYISEENKAYDLYTLTFPKTKMKVVDPKLDAYEKLKWFLCYNILVFDKGYKAVFTSANKPENFNPSTNIRVFKLPIKLNTELYNMYCKLSSNKNSDDYKKFISYFSTGNDLPFEISMILMGGGK